MIRKIKTPFSACRCSGGTVRKLFGLRRKYAGGTVRWRPQTSQSTAVKASLFRDNDVNLSGSGAGKSNLMSELSKAFSEWKGTSHKKHHKQKRRVKGGMLNFSA